MRTLLFVTLGIFSFMLALLGCWTPWPWVSWNIQQFPTLSKLVLEIHITFQYFSKLFVNFILVARLYQISRFGFLYLATCSQNVSAFSMLMFFLFCEYSFPGFPTVLTVVEMFWNFADCAHMFAYLTISF